MSLDPGGTLLLLGAGKMGGAMLEGWLAMGLDPRKVVIRDPNLPEDVSATLRAKGVAVNPPPGDVGPVAVVLLAVKPQVMAQAMAGLGDIVGTGTLAVSIMAGKTIAGIAEHLPQGVAIVRSIPNTPAAVGRGITGAYANAQVTPAQRDLAGTLLQAIGQVEWVEREDLIDACTAVSGSGPAYVFNLVEAMAAAGVAAGLPEDLSMRLARATVCGAGELLYRSPESAATLRQNVTSPAGTTAAALEVLMADDGLTPLMTRAVEAARRRAGELAG